MGRRRSAPVMLSMVEAAQPCDLERRLVVGMVRLGRPPTADLAGLRLQPPAALGVLDDLVTAPLLGVRNAPAPRRRRSAGRAIGRRSDAVPGACANLANPLRPAAPFAGQRHAVAPAKSGRPPFSAFREGVFGRRARFFEAARFSGALGGEGASLPDISRVVGVFPLWPVVGVSPR